jgi:hypothetical protein
MLDVPLRFVVLREADAGGGEMTAPIRLTAKQAEFLRACAASPQSPWDAAATTVNVLKKHAFIEQHRGILRWCRYIATDAGRAWLQQEGNNGRE